MGEVPFRDFVEQWQHAHEKLHAFEKVALQKLLEQTERTLAECTGGRAS